jgi:hypothetical protein
MRAAKQLVENGTVPPGVDVAHHHLSRQMMHPADK